MVTFKQHVSVVKWDNAGPSLETLYSCSNVRVVLSSTLAPIVREAKAFKARFATRRFSSREQAKPECDWLVMASVFVASQSRCFFLCSREKIRLVKNRLGSKLSCEHTMDNLHVRLNFDPGKMTGHTMRLEVHTKMKIHFFPNSPLYDVTAGDKCVMNATLGLYPESTAGVVSHDLSL